MSWLGPEWWRSRLAPVMILVAVLSLLGLALLVDGDDGSDVELTAGVAPTTAPSSTTSTDRALSETEAVASPLTLPTPSGPAPTAAPDTRAEPDTTPAPEQTTTTPPPAPSCDDPWADLAGCGWPGPGNTGPRSGNCPNGLTDIGDTTTGRVTVTDDGAVLSCQRITGAVVIEASDVTIADSLVRFDGGGAEGGGGIVVGDGASATVERVEVDGLDHTPACVWYQGESLLVDGLDCHGTTDGVFSWARTGVSATSGDNFTVRDSYFHDFTPNASNGHMDGFQTQGAANGTIGHNTFLMPIEANSAVAIWNDEKSSAGITVTGNLMAGAQYTVYAMDTSPSGGYSVTDIVFSDNVFSNRVAGCIGEWGAWFDESAPTDGWRRSGNLVLETGQSLDGGNHDCR